MFKRVLPVLLTSLSLSVILVGLVLADTTSTLLPTADGGDDSANWSSTLGLLACSLTDCYLEVDEGTCDDDTSYIESNTNGATQTFDIDESSIPDDATITQIDISVCAKRVDPAAKIQTRRCVDGTCTNSGSNINAGNSYSSSTQSHTGLSITKTASTDLEIGIANTTANGVRVSRVAAVVTYSTADITAPGNTTDLATGTPTSTSMPLSWTAAGDDGSSGTATSYDVRYSTGNITSGNWSNASQVTGEPTPSAAGSSESMSVSGLSPNTTYHFALKTSDEAGNESALSNVVNKYTLANVPTAAPFGTVTTTSIVADWLSNSNPAGTEYYIENQTAATNSGWITDTQWTSSALTASTAYTFRVKARNGDGTETAWLSLGSKSTSADTLSNTSDSSSTTTTTTSTTSATPTPTPTIAPATGPKLAAPTIAPKPAAAEIGAPGTTTPNTSTGETTTEVPIKPTDGDITPPVVTIDSDPEIVAENSFTFSGEANEVSGEFSGVIAGLSYSFDGGVSWHPVTTADGLGTENASFTVTTPNLPDGTYDLIVRARDNSKNEGFSDPRQATVDLLPVIFGSAALIPPSGEGLLTSNPTVAAGSKIKIIAALEGGVTNAQIEIGGATETLEADDIRRRFTATVTLKEPGSYAINLKAEDGAGNSLTREVGTVTVLPTLTIIDAATEQPKSGASVLLERLDASAGIWRVDQTPGQTNPQVTPETGTVTFFTSRDGTYRLRLSAPGHWRGVSEKFSLTDPTTLTGRVWLPRRPWYHYLIPTRTRPWPLKSADLLASSGAEQTDLAQSLDLNLTDTAGQARTITEFSGHRLLISTIAGWNRSSQEQLAVLARLQQELGKDVIVAPWLVQQPGSVLKGIIERGGYDLTGLVDATGQDIQPLESDIFPSHFVFDRQGKLIKTRTGFTTLSEFIELLGNVQ